MDKNNLIACDQFGQPLTMATRILNNNPEIRERLESLAVDGRLTIVMEDGPGLTVSEAGKFLGLKRRRVTDLCNGRILAAMHYPLRWRIPLAEVHRLAKARSESAQACDAE